MALAYSKLTSKGQISVPAAVRQKLGIGPGSMLEWETEDSLVVVRRAGCYTSEDLHRALFSTAPKRRTLRALKEGIPRHLRKRHARR